MTDVDIYINFVLYAIYGKLSEADALMRTHGASVRRVARMISETIPIKSKQIYRGALLDPAKEIKSHATYTFLSWSEDLDVARWFASTRSVISEHAIAARPELRGYLFTQSTANVRVLFHHSWANLTALFGTPLESLALRHPLMGLDGYHQIGWALRTQREVITEPVDKLVPLAVEIHDTEKLDLKFAPPWLQENGSC